MTRRVLNLVAVFSLLLCMAVTILWVRSYWVSEDFYSHGSAFYQRHGSITYSFNLRSGEVAFG